ncbi:hypothetical protein L6R50_15530 [Myxococcota bacterium]|nr:hypothetical protein [Myxococcota bacterium]
MAAGDRVGGAAITGLLVALWASALAAGTPVRVEPDRARYAPGQQAVLRVTNETGAPVWVPGCRPFELQVFDDDRFRAVRWEPCEREAKATRLPVGASELPFTVPADASGRVYRAVLTFGSGCRDGLPLSGAGCKGFASRVSPSFRGGRGGE